MKQNTDNYLIFNEAPDALFIIAPSLIIQEVNKQASILSEYSKKELISENLAMLFSIEELNEKPFNVKGIEKNEIILYERKLKTKSGRYIPVEMKSKKLSNGNYLSIVRDISNRIKAREELEKSYKQIKLSEFRFRNLFNNIPLGIFIVDKEGNIENINKAMAIILGSPAPEISKQYNLFELPTLKGTNLLKDILTCLEQGVVFHKIYQYKSLWGKELFVMVHILPAVQDGSNKVMAIVEDYTEQKKQEFQLKILSEGVNHIPASVVVTDRTGNIIFINQQFLKLTGYGFDELIGQNPRIVKSGHHTKEFYKHMWDTIIAGENWTGELLNKKKNGELYWESTMITPIKNEMDEVTHFMAVKEDITEKKKFEQELKEAKEKAEESDRLKSSFLANMSHEIRTPLNAILGFTSLMRDYELDASKLDNFLDLIQLNGKQLLNIIDDVLLISKLQVNEIKCINAKFLLKSFFESLYRYFHIEISTYKNKKLKLILDIPEEDYFIETDKQKLNQVLTKLIRNAVKFTDQGNIIIGYRLDAEQKPVFFVIDQGIGISKEKQKIIFQRFRQADDTKTRKYGGTGLGLSIAKSLIDLMKGSIWVESEEGKGARFYFSLPVKAVLDENSETKPENMHWQEKNILVVDDVPESILLIKEILSSTKVNIINAQDGIEAIEKAKRHKNIDLILMDIQLPRLNGMEAAKKILSFRKLPIIVFSAFLEEQYKDQCKLVGFKDYIQKPINPNELMRKITGFLNEEQ